MALPKEAEALAELPFELKALSGTMAPIVLEVLRTAERRGVIEPETAARLTEEVATLQRMASPNNTPHEDTLKPESRVLEELGDDIVPKLFAALSQPNRDGPPPEVVAKIRRLSKELALDESATAEDVLEWLMKGL